MKPKTVPLWKLIYFIGPALLLAGLLLWFCGCYWPYYQYREFDPITGNKTKEETLGIYSVAIVGERQDIEGQTANMLLTVRTSKHKPDPNTVKAAAEIGAAALIPVK